MTTATDVVGRVRAYSTVYITGVDPVLELADVRVLLPIEERAYLTLARSCSLKFLCSEDDDPLAMMPGEVPRQL